MSTDGVSVANNLFTDLGPLIALFGEQVSKQFLSQSLGLADCVLFAMAPLGIITGIVSAIRLSGYTWLRAIVGRAAETRGAAGVELTSATSSDICELWDGQSVVRVIGTPTILTVVYSSPGGLPARTKHNYDGYEETDFLMEDMDEECVSEHEEDVSDPTARVLDFEDAKQRKWLTSRLQYELRRKRSAQLPGNLRGESVEQSEDVRPARIEQLEERPIPIPPISPNIALNIKRRPSRRLVQVAALVVAILQAAVLIIGGVLTYDRSYSDQAPGNNFGFPMLVGGTFSVCFGLFLCAYMVLESSKKEYWQISIDDDGNPLVHLVWLQKGQTVNDQSFPTFAIRPDQTELLVSYADESLVQTHDQRVLWGVALALAGFIIQFVGFRNTHWAISIAQLVAMICATLIRVFVQMPFAKVPHCKELPERFELEWMTFEIHPIEHWWPYTTSTHFRNITSKDLMLDAQLALKSRVILGDMAYNLGWESNWRNDAVMAKTTIDAFLNELWSGGATMEKQATQLNKIICPFHLGNDTGDIESPKNVFHFSITRERHPGGWTKWSSDLREIEALISLWLFQISLTKTNAKGTENNLTKDGTEGDIDESIISQFTWLISPVSPSSCLDFDYWIRRSHHAFRIEDKSNAAFLTHDGLLAMRSPQCENLSKDTATEGPACNQFLLAMMTYSTLPRMCGRYLFASVVRHGLKYVLDLNGDTSIHGDASACNADNIAFRNTMIDNLTDVSTQAKLFNSQDALAVIIPALSERRLLKRWQKLDLRNIFAPKMALRHALLRIINVWYQSKEWENSERLDNALDISQLEDSIVSPLAEALHRANIIRRGCIRVLQSGGRRQDQYTISPGNDLGEEKQSKETNEEQSWFLNMIQLEYKEALTSLPLPDDFLLHWVSSETDLPAASSSLNFHDRDVREIYSDSRYGTSLFDETCPWKLAMLLSYRPGVTTLNSLLFHAVKRGNCIATFMILLESMNDPHMKRLRSTIQNLLCSVIELHHNEILEILLFYAQRPIDMTAVNDHHPLFTAATLRNIDAIKLLLSAGLSTESRGLDGFTILQSACSEGLMDLVQILVAHGAAIDAAVSRRGVSALVAAIQIESLRLVEYLLQKGADPNPPCRSYGTPLQVAVKKQNMAIVVKLVNAGADVNYPAPLSALTALQIAVEAGQISIAQYLIQHGADPLNSGSRHQQPSQMAPMARNLEAVEFLQTAGAIPSVSLVKPNSIPPVLDEPNLRPENEATMVSHNSRASSDNDNIRTISRHSIDPGSLGNLGVTQKRLPYVSTWAGNETLCASDIISWTPLQLAAHAGDEVLVSTLLMTEDVNAAATLFKGRTALQAACEQGYDAIVTMLLPFADANAERAEIGGVTALEAACGGGHVAVVKRLLDAGADVNTDAGVEGGTPLQMACRNGHLQVVKMLLQRGAMVDANPAEFRGMTAIEAAREGGWIEVVEFLQTSIMTATEGV